MRMLDDLLLCLGFYTRLPLPRVDLPMARFASAQWAAPIAGIVVALTGGAVNAGAAALGLPALPAAILTLAATLLVTGALHEDGLADVADGFGGGRDRARKLQIMRDSRIGTYGSCALVLSLGLKAACLAALPGPFATLAALVAAHGAGRGLIAGFWRFVPPARTDGLAASGGRPSVASAIVAAGLGVVCLLALGPFRAALAAALLLLWALALAALARRQVGGQTGDVLGGLEQGAEIIVLLIAVSGTLP